MQNYQHVGFINQDHRGEYSKIPKRYGCFLNKHILRNMNQMRMSEGRNGKSSTSLGETETIVQNRYSYQIPAMVGTNASTNKNYKLYNSTVQNISRGEGYYTTKVGALCARFVDMESPAM